jgi:hypothetical protein
MIRCAKLTTLWTALLLSLGLTTVVAGCGSTQQDVAVEPTKVPTPVENLRAALAELAATGEKTSGTELLKDDIAKLRGTEGVDADALQKDLDAILAAGSPAQVSAKAKEMLAKLPK